MRGQVSTSAYPLAAAT